MNIEKLLIVKISSLGDVVHMLPAVTDIYRMCPEIHIDWVVEEGFVQLPALHPAVNRVIPVALRRWRRDPGRALRTEFRRFAQALRARAYDRVLDSQGLLKSAVITRLARGVRCGQDFRCARESLAARFYDRTFFVPLGRHAVVRNRELAALALGLPLPEGEADYGIEAPAAPTDLDLPARYMVCLHGASRESKLWPHEHWLALIRVLTQQGMGVVLPWGSAEEHMRAEAIAEATAGGRVLPWLDLKSLAGVLGGARAVVGLDSGLSHLAVALNRPTVALYTDTNPALTGVVGQAGRAINLGGEGMMPTPDQVLLELAEMSSHRHFVAKASCPQGEELE